MTDKLDRNIETLKKVFDFIKNEAVSREEVVSFMEDVVASIEKAKTSLSGEIAEILASGSQELQKLVAETKSITSTESATLEARTNQALSTLSSELSKALTALNDKIASVQNGYTPVKGIDYFDGLPGKPADETVIIERVLERRAAIVDGPEEIRNKLELLNGDERLDKTAVKGLDILEEQLKIVAARPITRGGTPQGIRLYVDGGKKGLAQYINLIAGTGISLSYAIANGRNDITISATGTVALTPITMTGTINDTNTSFTASSTPTIVIVNGTAYRHGKGVTISGTSVTLDNPVGTGGDIYGL